MPKAFPDRWIAYKACGNVIEGTRIICFKVPLKTSIQTKNPIIKEIWDVQTLLQSIPNLGLVIDLTNTKRYYDPNLVKSAGVEHLKLLMLGRELPPESSVTTFMGAIDDFLQNDKDRLVGVHCTHGLNRTGYMVCRYMRDRMAIPAREAIKRFELARGYKIERRVYIDDILQTKSSPEIWRERDGSMAEKGMESPLRAYSKSPHERKEGRNSYNSRSWTSSNNKQRDTDDNWRSANDKGRESGDRTSYDRQKRGTRDSRRSLFERAKTERKNNTSSCDEIDYTFDY